MAAIVTEAMATGWRTTDHDESRPPAATEPAARTPPCAAGAGEVGFDGPFFDGTPLEHVAYRVPVVTALDGGLFVYARSW